MNVLYLTNIPAPYRVEFFNLLGKYCSLTVLYERKSASDRNNLWKSEKNKNFKEIYLTGKQIGNDNSLCLRVTKYLKGYDCIIIGGYSTFTSMIAIMYLKWKKIPFVLNADGGFIKQDESKYKYLIKKFFISKASHWFSTSKETTSYLKYYGAIPSNIYMYPFTSISNELIIKKPLDIEQKKKFKINLGIKESKVILSVGQFIYRKGFDILIKSMENIDKNTALVLVGDKPTDEYLSLVEKLNLTNVYFVPFCSKEELKKYYLAADVFVLPTREDIWGLVINEALAYGLPVITSENCGAGLELVKEENGYLFETSNIKDLSEKIKLLINNNLKREEMSKKNILLAQNYTIEKMAEKHYELLKGICK